MPNAVVDALMRSPNEQARYGMVGGPLWKDPRGLLERGNIDLYSRPQVPNPDGSVSTVRSLSFNSDGREVVAPTVMDNGSIVSDNAAIDNYFQTGRHLGQFDTPQNAINYAQALHDRQALQYPQPSQSQLMPPPAPPTTPPWWPWGVK